MKKSIFTILVFLLFTIACERSAEGKTDTQVLNGATVFDGKGNRIDNAVLVIENGSITYLGADQQVIPKNAEVIDVSGKFITPGLVDAHIHFFQTAFFDSRPDAFDIRDSIPYEEVVTYQKENAGTYFETYLRSGVTAVYDVGDFGWTIELAKRFKNDSLALHIAAAGPLLTPVPPEYISIFNTDEDTVMIHLGDPKIGVDHVNRISKMGATGVKIWSVAVNDSVFMESLEATAKAIENAGNQLIVHATSLDQAKAALRLNAKLLVHSVEDAPVDQEFLDLSKKNGTYYNPTLVVYDGYLNTYKAILGDGFDIIDPNGVVDRRTKTLLQGAASFKNFHNDTTLARRRIESGKQRAEFRDSIMTLNLKKVHQAGIPIVVGTDAGNPGTLHGISIYDEMEAIQDAGIPALDIITMATKNGAEVMRRGNDFGTLEKGKLADLIILEKDPSQNISNMRTITHVMRSGNLMPVDKSF